MTVLVPFLLSVSVFLVFLNYSFCFFLSHIADYASYLSASLSYRMFAIRAEKGRSTPTNQPTVYLQCFITCCLMYEL